MSESVSVCIPAHQAEAWVEQAIASVLAQPHQQIEIVVADDGSTDASAAVALAAGARVERFAKGGIGAARNRLVNLARGELLAFLDADDMLTADGLTRRLAALAAQPGLEIVFGQERLFSEIIDGKPIPIGPSRAAHSAAAMLVRRATLERVGPFREDTEIAADLDWLLRAHELGVCKATVEQQVLWRRVHGNNHSIRHAPVRTSEWAGALKASIDRRRGVAS